VCALSKAEWTLFVDKTRTFQVSAKKKGALRLRLWDADLEDVVEDQPFVLFSEDGAELQRGALDDEGAAKIPNAELGKLCLVAFPGRAVLPHPDYAPLQPTPGRFACVTSELYEFRLSPWVSTIEAEPEPAAAPLLVTEREPVARALLEVEPEPRVVTVLEIEPEPVAAPLLEVEPEPAPTADLDVLREAEPEPELAATG
jgi:hypothetical protein